METTTLRRAEMDMLLTVLQQQQAAKNDIVVPATKIRSEDGIIIVQDADVSMSLDGVTSRPAHYTPTTVFNEGLAAKLNIPVGYLRRMHETRPDLYDANVNGWLHGTTGYPYPADQREFLVRAFSDGNGGGIARSIQSDSYRIIDDLDILETAFQGIAAAGLDLSTLDIKGDLSERHMRVTIRVPQISAAAPYLLQNYRYGGRSGQDFPLIDAGLVIKNSETGCGAFSIAPHLTVQVCSNGMTMTTDAQRQVHLGGRMEAGIVRQGDDTKQKELELVRLRTRDAVQTFLDVDYLSKTVAKLEEKAGKPLEGAPDKVVRHLSKSLGFSDDLSDTILGQFIKGGDVTAGGFLHAVTAAAHEQSDPDTAAMLEESALRALDAAYALR